MKKESDEKKKQRNKIVAENIKNFQIKKGISTPKLAQQTGISESGLRNYRSGARMPDTQRLFSIANALGVLPKDLKTSRGLLKNIEEELIKYNFNANELQAVIENLYLLYGVEITKPTIDSYDHKYLDTAIKRCKKIIDKYFLDNTKEISNLTNDSLSFVATLLEDINVEYILNSYSVPIFSFLELKRNNGNFKNLKPISRDTVNRNNLELDYKYFGISIDFSPDAPSYSFERNSIIILKQTKEMSANEIGLFAYFIDKEDTKKYVDLIRLDGSHYENSTHYYFVSAQDGRHSPLPYSIKKENLDDYDFNLIGVVSLIFLPKNEEISAITFKNKK